jgi:hypothetical protein
VCAPDMEEHFPPLRSAVREGGSLVTIWRRDGGGPPAGGGPDLAFRRLVDDVDVQVGRASGGVEGSFRLVVRRRGAVEEEYDGLTVGGATDAATVVNTHSRVLRIE